jgi:adenosylcobinamide kinase / adenosylcobinamide-phosphate guanylyltransferase
MGMILVIGGVASGKRTYVQEQWGYGDGDLADAVLDERPVLYNLQDLVKADPQATEALLPKLTGKAVVICNEVGCGVVPAARGDRIWRETTGRLCIALAEQAERVVRMHCGIPLVIKG